MIIITLLLVWSLSHWRQLHFIFQFIRHVRKIAKSDNKIRHVCLSVRMEQICSHRTDFHEIWYVRFFENGTRITGTVHRNNTIQYNAIQYNTTQYNTIQRNTMQYNAVQYNAIHICITYRSVHLRIRNVSDRRCIETANTQSAFGHLLPSKIVQFMIKTVGPNRPQMAIWRMRVACWIPKATNTHSQYAILKAFPLQQWPHAHASRYAIGKVRVLLQSTIEHGGRDMLRGGCSNKST